MLDFNERVTNEALNAADALPDDTYTVTIESHRMKRTKKGGIMPSMLLRVQEGVATGFAENGRVHFEDFWLGTETDPDGEDPATRKQKGYKEKYDLVQLFAQATIGGFDGRGRSGEGYWEALFSAMDGKQCRVLMRRKHEPAKDGYDAKDRNIIRGVFSMTEKLPGQGFNGLNGGAEPQVPRRPFTIQQVD